MTATELFVEQLLIGLAVLATSALLASQELAESVFKAGAGGLAVLTAAAYLVGILFDRFSDTLLAELEQHHRLDYALDLLERGKAPEGDPFPEDKYRTVLLENQQATEYAHYLRSRIRLTRAMTCLLPAASVAIPAWLTAADPSDRTWALSSVILFYVLAFGVVVRRRDPATAERIAEHPTRSFTLPKTEELRKRDVEAWYRKRARGIVLRQPLALATLVLAGIGAVLQAEQSGVAGGVLTFIGGVGLTAFAGWTWWRITETSHTFLRDFDRFCASAS